jgi:F-type H+-transporting ATPase subunit b
MTIDPLTFALEIVNFLVLVWLLRHFLYQPIRNAIAQRQRMLEQGLKDAQLREQAAAARQNEYQQNLDTWEAEKARQQAALQQDLTRDREKALAKVRTAVEAERLRLQTLAEQEGTAQKQHIREQAAQMALQLTRRMLERLAGSELDEALLRMLLEDLDRLPEDDLVALRTAAAQQQGRVTVSGAHPLSEPQVKHLQQDLARLFAREVHCTVETDPQLISGLRLSIGDRVLHANLGDELAFFHRGLTADGR